MTKIRLFTTALAAASLAALSACGSSTAPVDGASEAAATTATSGESLAAALQGAPDMKTLSRALTATGLATVMEGQGGYTLLAPGDAAFAKLGDKAALLSEPEQKAALAAILRNHILPGAIDLSDIARAIDGAGGKPVTMRTMGSGTVSFAKEATTIVVTGEGGSKARLGTSAITAGSNVALPIDTLLVPG